MSRLSLWKFNGNSSGTTPTTIFDSDPFPINLSTNFNGTASWANVSGYGNVLRYPNANTSTFSSNASISGSKITTAFDGTRKTGTIACAVQVTTGFGNSNYGALGVGWAISGNLDGMILQAGDKNAGAGIELGLAATIGGTDGDYVILPSLPSAGWHVFQSIVDTGNATANLRARIYMDGFLAADASSGTAGTITQNAVLTAAASVESGALSLDTATYILEGLDQGGAALYDHAFTDREALAQALRWFAASATDSDPDAAGANLYAASTSGGTNDVSSSTSDHTISFTVTIGATNNRKVIIPISYMGVTSGITSITFNGSSTGVHLSAQQQSTFSSLAGCDIYEILDADLPGAGTYTISVTVDGASGVTCGSPVYVESVDQSYATNTGLATGTSTSITATLSGSASAGSIMIGQLLDVSFGDAPTSSTNQLRLVSQSTSSTIRQVVDAEYITASGSNSMSWSNLTNTSGKIAVVIEALKYSAGISGTSFPTYNSYVTA